jgi:hypothetical protein
MITEFYNEMIYWNKLRGVFVGGNWWSLEVSCNDFLDICMTNT